MSTDNRRPTRGRRDGGILVTAWREMWSDEEALAEHRDRIAERLIALAAIVCAVLLVYQAASQRLVLAGLITVVLLFLVLNLWSLRRQRRPIVPYWLLVLAVSVSALFATAYQGFYGIFWSFPILFAAYFVMPRRQATWMGLGLTVSMALVTGYAVGVPPAIRAAASLGLTLMMITSALSIIGELQRALTEQAITDPLTGAFNRRHLQTELARLQPPESGQRTSHALLSIDIDHFKLVNDYFGHAVGDAVLQKLVAAIKARKRASDLLFRTGGEEFMVLLHRTSEVQARAIAEDLRERLESQAWLPNGDSVTISIGVNCWRPGETVDAWLIGADRALYEAKREGRNRVTVAGDGDA
ncbi:MAG: diguanylate cyclase [Rubrivivax sp.]